MVRREQHQRIAAIRRVLQESTDLEVERRHLRAVLRRERSDDVRDRIHRRPVRIDVGRLVALGEQPRDDRLERRGGDVAGVGRALVQHAGERGARKVVRIDRERARHPGGLQTGVHRLSPEERLRRAAEFGVGERHATVERPPADHLGHHVEFGQVQRVGEQPVRTRRHRRVDRPERRDGGRRKHRGDRVVADGPVFHCCPSHQLAQVRRVARGDLALELQMAESVRDDDDDLANPIGHRLRQHAAIQRRQLDGLSLGRQQPQHGRRDVRQAAPGEVGSHEAFAVDLEARQVVHSQHRL